MSTITVLEDFSPGKGATGMTQAAPFTLLKQSTAVSPFMQWLCTFAQIAEGTSQHEIVRKIGSASDKRNHMIYVVDALTIDLFKFGEAVVTTLFLYVQFALNIQWGVLPCGSVKTNALIMFIYSLPCSYVVALQIGFPMLSHPIPTMPFSLIQSYPIGIPLSIGFFLSLCMFLLTKSLPQESISFRIACPPPTHQFTMFFTFGRVIAPGLLMIGVHAHFAFCIQAMRGFAIFAEELQSCQLGFSTGNTSQGMRRINLSTLLDLNVGVMVTLFTTLLQSIRCSGSTGKAFNREELLALSTAFLYTITHGKNSPFLSSQPWRVSARAGLPHFMSLVYHKLAPEARW